MFWKGKKHSKIQGLELISKNKGALYVAYNNGKKIKFVDLNVRFGYNEDELKIYKGNVLNYIEDSINFENKISQHRRIEKGNYTVEDRNMKSDHENAQEQGSKIAGGRIKIQVKEKMTMVNSEIIGENVDIQTKDLVMNKENLKREMIEEITKELIKEMETKLKLEENKDKKFVAGLKEIVSSIVSDVISNYITKYIGL